MAVVVPAHDERDLLPACLTALSAAAAAVESSAVESSAVENSAVESSAVESSAVESSAVESSAVESSAVEIIVVADACRDDTAALAAAAGAEVVTIEARNVGRARAAGMRHALRHGPDGLWLATTDADSRVGPGWLAWQLAHAAAGADLLIGTVEVDDWSRWPDELRPLYEDQYRAAGPAHVHGANLGCSAAAYLAVGGFRPLPHDEDRDLIARFRAAGARVVTDPTGPVRTSARAVGKAPLGFAAFLTALAAELA